MAEQTLTCPDCGKVGTVTHEWVKPGVASGTIMTGLDPDNCEGCRETLNKHGYAVVRQNPDGTIEAE
ncbi:MULTISPECIES: hypothetical protein [Streptomycetaceae]|uniref:hypothetical protein n=1 Tax=Streptomycetaceae TaxID=2062 RepID=UPI000213EE77|nr:MULTISPECIES: hypothetical protein [Streptomycetaceae]MYS57514.1 hypothetical protein [Streptomyces sp. SID5468]CCB73104.1 protein of unknown function [Streptantibioticus cattleyicolor NRRL 8057 = DSM 46488]